MKFIDIEWQHNQIPEFYSNITEFIKQGTYILSKEVKEFENEWARYIGVKYAIGVNSGTDALSIALRAAGIKKGDKVIVQANTFAATVYAIIHNQAIPVFVDVDLEYGCISLKDLKEVIFNEENIKGIILVHLYGQPYFIDEVKSISQESRLILIEDCAQSHGALWRGKKTGSFGEMGCFSFFPSKNLGAIGDAGIICTNNEKYMKLIMKYRNLGAEIKHVHTEKWATNSRLDSLQALVLSMKLRYLDKWNERRRKIAQMYRECLKDLPVLLYKEHPDAFNVYHQFIVIVENRDKIIEKLNDNGIPTLIHYPVPVHKAEAFKRYSNRELPVVEWISKRHFSLPMSPHLSDKEVEFICEKLKEALKNEPQPKFVYS